MIIQQLGVQKYNSLNAKIAYLTSLEKRCKVLSL